VKSLDEIKPGLTLGRYECLLPIARGGMAAVWAARVTGARGFEKIVAVKTMLPSLNDDPNFERMFLDEARIASRIRHPNVAEILDLGEQDNLLYLVMEWIDGAPLSLIMRESFRRGGMPIPIGVKIVQDVCAALHAAHELKGEDGKSLELVHRDVSPQNIMLTESGVVKLVDFGVAKALGRSAGETDTGLIRGKLAYLSPEQVVAQPLDRRTDLFAAGVILYQMTTGKHPFRGDNAGATMNNILRRKVPKPNKIVGPAYPALLDEIVMRAIDREQEFRFQTGADMFKALDEVFVGRQRATTEDVAAYISPIIGPAGDEFRRALRQASRAPSSSGEDVAALLASGAHPVEGTPASGQWMIGSGNSGENAAKTSSGAVSSDGVELPPAPPDFDPIAASSADKASASKSAHGAGSLAESTMSGAERDTRPPSRPASPRRTLGIVVLGAVLVCAVAVLLVAKFVSPSSKASADAVAPPNTDVSAQVAPGAGPNADAETAVMKDAPVEEAAPSGPDGGRAETGTPEVAPSATADTPPPATVAPRPPSTRPTSTKPAGTKPPGSKQWTPPVSDPGF
jgi:serine/threonine protein kinase